VVVCKTGETLAQIALLRSGPVPRGGLRLGGAIPFPIAGMVGTPLACAVAAGLAIFRIADEFPLAALAAAPLLARRKRAGGLLRVKSGWLELPLAKPALQVHPYRVAALSKTMPAGEVSRSGLERDPARLRKSQLGKNTAAPAASNGAAQLIGRLTAPQKQTDPLLYFLN
jgi:hypothetical protein